MMFDEEEKSFQVSRGCVFIWPSPHRSTSSNDIATKALVGDPLTSVRPDFRTQDL